MTCSLSTPFQSAFLMACFSFSLLSQWLVSLAYLASMSALHQGGSGKSSQAAQ